MKYILKMRELGNARKVKSRWRELNPRSLPYQGSALPLSHNGD